MVVHLPRGEDSIARDHRDRLRKLEREKKKPTLRPGKVVERAPFSQNGAVSVTAAGDEPIHDVMVGGKIRRGIIRLKTAGTSNTVVTFYLNGSSLGTVTAGSGVTRVEGAIGTSTAVPGDGISARITTAGTGAKGLSAFVEMVEG